MSRKRKEKNKTKRGWIPKPPVLLPKAEKDAANSLDVMFVKQMLR